MPTEVLPLLEQHGSIRDMLLAHDITPTQQRLVIAHVLFSRAQHVSAEQLLDQVNRSGNIASKATIYNTLGLFAEKGLVREVIIAPGKVFYDSNTEHHHHIYNVDTGALTDISGQELHLKDTPQAPHGTELESVDIIIRVRNQTV